VGNMRLLFVGGLWTGSTTVHRLRAFERIPGLSVTAFDTGDQVGGATFIDRVAHRLRRPIDWRQLNPRLLKVAAKTRPDVVFFDNIKVTRPETLRRLRNDCGAQPVFYTPDNVIAPHNSSRQLEASWKEWSVVFTTKHFNVPDFAARGVRATHVIGNAFDSEVHRPLEPQDVGPDYERFDLAFAGVAETERKDAINCLAFRGLRVIVFGDAPTWGEMHPNVSFRPFVWDLDYSRAMHMAKLSLCFLRRINLDTVTTRSFEIPAMARPMVAERTAHHDAAFADGLEYLGFSSHDELVSTVVPLIADEPRRHVIARAARERCLRSRYSTVDRAREMVDVMESALVRG
jgi:spore maturation protein CgeB